MAAGSQVFRSTTFCTKRTGRCTVSGYVSAFQTSYSHPHRGMTPLEEHQPSDAKGFLGHQIRRSKVCNALKIVSDGCVFSCQSVFCKGLHSCNFWFMSANDRHVVLKEVRTPRNLCISFFAFCLTYSALPGRWSPWKPPWSPCEALKSWSVVELGTTQSYPTRTFFKSLPFKKRCPGAPKLGPPYAWLACIVRGWRWIQWIRGKQVGRLIENMPCCYISCHVC